MHSSRVPSGSGSKCSTGTCSRCRCTHGARRSIPTNSGTRASAHPIRSTQSIASVEQLEQTITHLVSFYGLHRGSRPLVDGEPIASSALGIQAIEQSGNVSHVPSELFCTGESTHSEVLELLDKLSLEALDRLVLDEGGDLESEVFRALCSFVADDVVEVVAGDDAECERRRLPDGTSTSMSSSCGGTSQ